MDACRFSMNSWDENTPWPTTLIYFKKDIYELELGSFLLRWKDWYGIETYFLVLSLGLVFNWEEKSIA